MRPNPSPRTGPPAPRASSTARLAAAGSTLLVTGDGALVADLHRLAAAAGAPLDVVGHEAAELRARWASAPVVLVGADALPTLAAACPVRRDGVHVVARGALPDAGFPAALAVGAQSVVELPGAETWLVETLTDAADGAEAPGRVVGVVGGCGGAGATTFATALAMAAASAVHPVTLVDVDPLGAGIEPVVGVDEDGSGWTSLLQSAGRLGSRALRAALPERDGVAVLGWGRGGRTDLDRLVVREAMSAARRGCRLVVVDLPRYTGPATAEALARCDDLVLVVPADVTGVAAAARVVADVVPLVPRAHLVTRGARVEVDPQQVAEVLGLPLAATMGDQRRLQENVELGLGPMPSRRGPLARAARATLEHLSQPMPLGTPR